MTLMVFDICKKMIIMLWENLPNYFKFTRRTKYIAVIRLLDMNEL